MHAAVVALLLLIHVPLAESGCLPGWQAWNSRCYLAVATSSQMRLSDIQGNNGCPTNPFSSFATIYNASELQVVRQATNNSAFMLGIYSNGTHWKWASNEVFGSQSYHNFSGGAWPSAMDFTMVYVNSEGNYVAVNGTDVSVPDVAVVCEQSAGQPPNNAPEGGGRRYVLSAKAFQLSSAQTRPSSSLISCALQCRGHPNCVSFSFSNDTMATNRCLVSTAPNPGMLYDAHSVVYKRGPD